MRTMAGWWVLLLLLAGCTTTPVTVDPDQALQRWVGQPLQTLEASWGPATEERDVGGEHLYLWTATRYGNRYFPSNLDATYPQTTAGSRDDWNCHAVFSVDAAGTITAAEWRGEECRQVR